MERKAEQIYYNVETGEAYEVKPHGVSYKKNPTRYTEMAKKQLRTYIEGTLPAPSIQKHKIEQTDLQPGKQPLSGIIYDDKTDNTIEYDCSDGDGIIGYIVYK